MDKESQGGSGMTDAYVQRPSNGMCMHICKWCSYCHNLVQWEADRHRVCVCVSLSEHYHVFVGDVSPDIESHQLREAFAPFGQISSVSFLSVSFLQPY